MIKTTDELIKTINYIYDKFGHNYVMARFKTVGALNQYIDNLEVMQACQRIWSLDPDFYNIDKGEEHGDTRR